MKSSVPSAMPQSHPVHQKIVAGGGWVEIRRTSSQIRPRASFFKRLSVFWGFPSAASMVTLAPADWPWGPLVSFQQGLAAITFEQWIASLALLLHLVLVSLAIYYRCNEDLQEIEIIERMPNPDYDPRNLY